MNRLTDEEIKSEAKRILPTSTRGIREAFIGGMEIARDFYESQREEIEKQVTKTSIMSNELKNMINLTAEEIARIDEVYKKPFWYDYHGQMVFDKNDKQVCDIRGWGYLQQFKDGMKIQDNIGKMITELLNDHVKS